MLRLNSHFHLTSLYTICRRLFRKCWMKQNIRYWPTVPFGPLSGSFHAKLWKIKICKFCTKHTKYSIFVWMKLTVRVDGVGITRNQENFTKCNLSHVLENIKVSEMSNSLCNCRFGLLVEFTFETIPVMWKLTRVVPEISGFKGRWPRPLLHSFNI